MLSCLVLLCFCFSVVSSHSNWAVLVAGSNGYWNYRHQSDVCHAFQILTKLGQFKPENVIVMMYDDIANSDENPFQGNIINRPNGPNVYEGVKKDYTGDQVTARTFLDVLRGKADGPVLNSTADDNVFIYLTDHGATGLVGMPTGDPLYADDFLAALKELHVANKYHKMVIYIEACESGSMFENLLPTDMNIFATTASTASQSSYAWYYDDKRQAYLGDEYSVRWMEDSENGWSHMESLATQFAHVKTRTTKSQPQQYGEMDWTKESIQDFQGYDRWTSDRAQLTQETYMHWNGVSDVDVTPSWSSSRDVVLDTLRRRLRSADNRVDRELLKIEIQEELNHRLQTHALFCRIVKKVSGFAHCARLLSLYTPPRDFVCLKTVYRAFEESCASFSDFSLQFVRSLVTLCENFSTTKVLNAVREC